MVTINEQLYILCGEYIALKEATIKKTIADAQEAAANDTKSSAGDKYETGREVMQQEINLNLTRLNEVHKLRGTLERIVPKHTGTAVLPGSVVYTSNGNFYISISAGLLKVDGSSFYAISAASPLGAQLLGREAGFSIAVNGKCFVIEKVV